MDYAQAAQVMAGHSATIDRSYGAVRRMNPNMKKLKWRTWLVRTPANNDDVPDIFSIRYFQTDIIRLYKDHFEIDEGNYFGISTLQRLNEFMPRGFRVYGRTLRQTRTVLGFVQTPKGTFPFSHDLAFKYDGSQQSNNEAWLTRHADETIAILPKYVNECTARLLKKSKKGQLADAIPAIPSDEDFWTRPGRSQQIAFWVRHDLYGARPVHLALHDGHMLQEFTGDEVFNILAHSGAGAFTNQGRASQMESVLAHGRSIPYVRGTALRHYVKVVLYRYFIKTLGFKPLQWNRR